MFGKYKCKKCGFKCKIGLNYCPKCGFLNNQPEKKKLLDEEKILEDMHEKDFFNVDEEDIIEDTRIEELIAESVNMMMDDDNLEDVFD